MKAQPSLKRNLEIFVKSKFKKSYTEHGIFIHQKVDGNENFIIELSPTNKSRKRMQNK